jgi:K+-transporting ATPase ATPase A chain
MTIFGYIQLGLFLLVLLLLVKPLGTYMARVYQGERVFLSPVIKPAEGFIYRVTGVRADEEMSWKRYAVIMLLFNLAALFLLYAFLRLQQFLPLNPQGLPGVSPDLAFNTAISFSTNTNWQSYGGETTMSYFTQMLGLGVHNFLSAATGIAILIALIRGLVRHSAQTIGNYWVDMTRGILYILVPLSLVLAIFLVSQGVVQTFNGTENASLLQPVTDANGQTINDQLISVGPAASQIAIKQLGANGGGFFNVSSAHPFENSTPLSNSGCALLHLRQNGGRYPQGMGITGCDDDYLRGHAVRLGLG